MRKYESSREENYHQHTLYGMLDIKPSKNSIFKSMLVTDISDGVAHIECEPYDDAYDIEKAERVLKRRLKYVCKSLGVETLSVTLYNEWTAVTGLILSVDGR